MRPQVGVTALSSPPLDRLGALVERERQTRFAGGAFGYLWAYSTPVVWIALLVAAFWFLGRTPPITVGPEIFVATGILPYIMFRQTIASMMRSGIGGRFLLYLRPVSERELLLASAVLELVNMILTSLLIFGGILVLFDARLPASLLTVYAAMAAAWALGVGVGSLFAAIGAMSDTFARAVPLALRPMFWISGIFYTATELPKTALDLLWWNPLFHCIEALREGFFLGYRSPVAELWYPLVVAIACFLASAVVEQYVKDRRLARHSL